MRTSIRRSTTAASSPPCPKATGPIRSFGRDGTRFVVAQVDQPEGASSFGLDSRRAQQRLRSADPGSRLLVRRSYLLDELTLAVVWAVVNFDEALLTDDALLLGRTVLPALVGL